MDAAAILGIINILLTLLLNPTLKSLFDKKSNHEKKLEDLQQTIETIQGVLLDSLNKPIDDNHELAGWLGNLKEVFYDAEDLVATILAKAEQAERSQVVDDTKVNHFSQICTKFSKASVKLVDGFKKSAKLYKCIERLEKISKNHNNFTVQFEKTAKRMREKTGYSISEFRTIGRKTEMEAIVASLIPRFCFFRQGKVSYRSIVGMGGIGKTTLAQLVYNDNRIRKAFDLRFWVSVNEDFSLEGILSQIAKDNTHQTPTLAGLEENFRQKIKGKKYLIILDDVWNENPSDWAKLKDILDLGCNGSRVLVTSRSTKVSRIIENKPTCDLRAMSIQYSRELFDLHAFPQGSAVPSNKIQRIKDNIVTKCNGVPLALTVVGGLLCNAEESKWDLMENIDFSKLNPEDDEIMPILKFSYYCLSPSLKCCFSYCALLPENVMFEKEKLIKCGWHKVFLESPQRG